MTLESIVLFNEMDRHAEARKKARYGVIDEAYFSEEMQKDLDRGYKKWLNLIEEGVVTKQTFVEAKAAIGIKLAAQKLEQCFMNE